MEQKKLKKVDKIPPPNQPLIFRAKAEQEADCRCKEAQGKTMTDFLKVMIDDLAFWRKKH